MKTIEGAVPDARIQDHADPADVDQRHRDRRGGRERRGGLRWDPRQTDRRDGTDRRVPAQQDPVGQGTKDTLGPVWRSASP